MRVGTHALTVGSKSTLWNRLSTHRGTVGGSQIGGGNHRGSIFRLHVGKAMLARGDFDERAAATWRIGGTAPKAVREAEYPIELAVSRYVFAMPLLWVGIPGDAGTTSDRKLVEANAIALLTNRGRVPIDPPSPGQLGTRATPGDQRVGSVERTSRGRAPRPRVFESAILPAPVGTLISRYAGTWWHMNTTNTATDSIFPGGRSGEHIVPMQVPIRLGKLGITKSRTPGFPHPPAERSAGGCRRQSHRLQLRDHHRQGTDRDRLGIVRRSQTSRRELIARVRSAEPQNRARHEYAAIDNASFPV